LRVTFDPIKRAKTLAQRGLDFAKTAVVLPHSPRIQHAKG